MCSLRNDVSEWFPVNVGLRQGCLVSPWLFHTYMDGVAREVNVRVLENGLVLLSAIDGRFEINQLLFADDTEQVIVLLLFCSRSSSYTTDLSIHFQPSRPTTI